jgi:acyl-CoA synthetase (AMP-forming)/AMP-acid ligase II
VDNGSPHADERFGTIPRMVQANARRFATREAVVDGAVRLTFADVERDMTRVAAGLLASGVERGDRVALWAPNSASWIGAALGILAAGAWLVPVNTRFKGDEVAEILARTDARLLFTVDEFLGTDPLGMVRRASGRLAMRCSCPVPARTTHPDGATSSRAARAWRPQRSTRSSPRGDPGT